MALFLWIWEHGGGKSLGRRRFSEGVCVGAAEAGTGNHKSTVGVRGDRLTSQAATRLTAPQLTFVAANHPFGYLRVGFRVTPYVKPHAVTVDTGQYIHIPIRMIRQIENPELFLLVELNRWGVREPNRQILSRWNTRPRQHKISTAGSYTGHWFSDFSARNDVTVKLATCQAGIHRATNHIAKFFVGKPYPSDA